MTTAPAPTTAIVVVSHSPALARGVVEMAAQMAPDVTLRAAGGTDDGRIGTSFDLVMDALSALTDQAAAVVVLTDLGSATMTAETVLELLEDPGPVALADAPLVEGAVAAAVAAQSGGDLAAVRAAAEDAALGFAAVRRPAEVPAAEPPDVLERVYELRNQAGLHARAAAQLARLVAGFDAQVEINGADATSVLALMGLGLPVGGTMTARARGAQAEHALDAVGRMVSDRFGEE